MFYPHECEKQEYEWNYEVYHVYLFWRFRKGRQLISFEREDRYI